jgi:hypothetical protein
MVCGVPADLKRLASVNPPGTRRLEVVCDYVTKGLQALRHQPGILAATVFGQSMHLLADLSISEGKIREILAENGITEAEVRPIAPSLEDVFVALTSDAVGQGKEVAGV